MKDDYNKKIILSLELRKHVHPDKAKLYARFFKSGKGEYGEGDKFLGLTVPEQRSIAKKYVNMSLKGLEPYLKSPYHEFRLTALIILAYKYEICEKTKNEKCKKEIFYFYIKHHSAANNWDLVDVTVPRIVGAYLYENPEEKKILYEYAKSSNLWERRIAVLATFYFLSKEDFKDSLKIAEILLHDKHDLIHKAVGWMLREIGKRDQNVEERFLKKHYKKMPRTMLRYSIERFSEKKKKFYMKK